MTRALTWRMLESLAGEDLQGKRILLPRAAIARDVVPVELTKRGAIVDVVEAYRTTVPEGNKPPPSVMSLTKRVPPTVKLPGTTETE